jgi:hypothetical protein
VSCIGHLHRSAALASRRGTAQRIRIFGALANEGDQVGEALALHHHVAASSGAGLLPVAGTNGVEQAAVLGQRLGNAVADLQLHAPVELEAVFQLQGLL